MHGLRALLRAGESIGRSSDFGGQELAESRAQSGLWLRRLFLLLLPVGLPMVLGLYLMGGWLGKRGLLVLERRRLLPRTAGSLLLRLLLRALRLLRISATYEAPVDSIHCSGSGGGSMSRGIDRRDSGYRMDLEKGLQVGRTDRETARLTGNQSCNGNDQQG